jgi:internalin A
LQGKLGGINMKKVNKEKFSVLVAGITLLLLIFAVILFFYINKSENQKSKYVEINTISGKTDVAKTETRLEIVISDKNEKVINESRKTLSNLKHLTFLEELYITSPTTYLNFKDFEYLNIPTLKSIRFNWINSSNWSDVRNIPNLSEITIANSNFSDISDIIMLKNITEMSVVSCKVVTIPNLDTFSQLTYLSLYNNEITNIDNIGNNATIEILNISNNPIENYSPLLEMPNLKSLFVDTGALPNDIKQGLLDRGVKVINN